MAWLQRWYLEHCDGDWEHTHGIRIETLDSPGWSVRIDLKTVKRQIEMEAVTREGETDWYRCAVRSAVYEGFGGPENLEDILAIFRAKWEEES